MKSQARVIPQVVRRLSFEEWGGTETVVWNTSQQLKKSGVQPDILCTQALSKQAVETRENLTVRRFNYYYPYFNLTAEQTKRLDKKGGNPYSPELYHYLMEKPQLDLIHCHSMQRMAGIVRRVAKKRNIPYIVSFHGGHFQVPQSEIEDMCSAVKYSFHYGRIVDKFVGYQHYLRDADGIICVGYNEYEATKKRFPNKSVLYLPNGVTPEDYALADGKAFRQRYGIPKDVPLLLNVGRIDPQKNQLALLETLSALEPHIHLVLIGPPTNETYFQTLQQAIQTKGLQNRATLIPGLTPKHPDLIAAYHAADVFVLPSLHEPFGIVVLEAWASGLPVVVSNVGGLQALVSHGETGFKAEDSVQFAQAVQTLLSSSEIAQRFRQAAKCELYQKYTWSKVTATLNAFYESVIKKHQQYDAKACTA